RRASASPIAALPGNLPAADSAAWIVVDPKPDKPDAATRLDSRERARPPVDAAPGSVVSLQGFLQNRLVHFRLRQQLLQSPVLFLQLLQSLGFLRLHPTVLIPPPLERLLADLQALNHLADRLPRRHHRVCFTQLLDDLLRIVLLAFHRESSCPQRAVGLS